MTSTHRTQPRTAGYRVAIAAIIAMACAPGPVGPSSLPEGAIAYTPPAEYMTWWERTERCSGLSGDISRIEWYSVPGVDLMDTPIGQKVGLWQRDNGHASITLAGAFVDNELVVRHEMLHELLGRDGHPEEYYIHRCGLTWESWEHQT